LSLTIVMAEYLAFVRGIIPTKTSRFYAPDAMTRNIGSSSSVCGVERQSGINTPSAAHTGHTRDKGGYR